MIQTKRSQFYCKKFLKIDKRSELFLVFRVCTFRYTFYTNQFEISNSFLKDPIMNIILQQRADHVIETRNFYLNF